MEGFLLTQYTGKIVGPVAWLLGHLMNAIFSLLNLIGIPNIGLAIIIFTIVIYLCLLPLTYKQQKFSKLQSKMAPELKAIQAKYKGKKDNDSMLAMQQETKELYAKYGVSQTGSCLQLVIQMPILFALYRVIYAIPAYVTIVRNAFYPLVEQLRETDGAADFLQNLKGAAGFAKQFTNAEFVSGNAQYIENTYIDVLNKASTADWNSLSENFSGLASSIQSTHETLNRFNSFLGLNIGDTPMYMVQTAFSTKHFLLLLGAIAVPALAALTQWINVKLMPQAADNNNGGKVDADDPTAQMAQSMKTMNLMMPIMSAIFCLNLPAGMGIYWIAGAVVRSIQQIVINKHIDNTDIDAEIAKNTEKYKKKMEKMKTSPQMNRYANMSTRNINNTQTISASKEANEKALEKTRSIYQGKEIKKNSLLAKANMVKEFNENNNKQ